MSVLSASLKPDLRLLGAASDRLATDLVSVDFDFNPGAVATTASFFFCLAPARRFLFELDAVVGSNSFSESTSSDSKRSSGSVCRGLRGRVFVAIVFTNVFQSSQRGSSTIEDQSWKEIDFHRHFGHQLEKIAVPFGHRIYLVSDSLYIDSIVFPESLPAILLEVFHESGERSPEEFLQ